MYLGNTAAQLSESNGATDIEKYLNRILDSTQGKVHIKQGQDQVGSAQEATFIISFVGQVSFLLKLESHKLLIWVR